MSFESGLEFLTKYTDDRTTALLEGKRIKWSTAPVKSYDELLTPFDRKKEGQDWDALHNSSQKYDNYIKIRGKIAYLAGVGRDIRMQFCCNTPKRHRTVLDSFRYELLRLRFISKRIMVRLREQLKIK